MILYYMPLEPLKNISTKNLTISKQSVLWLEDDVTFGELLLKNCLLQLLGCLDLGGQLKPRPLPGIET
jgi:hypothetical protein